MSRGWSGSNMEGRKAEMTLGSAGLTARATGLSNGRGSEAGGTVAAVGHRRATGLSHGRGSEGSSR
jgi:hypothetical protein